MFKFLIIIFQVSLLSKSLDHEFLVSQANRFIFREDYRKCEFGTYQTPIHIQSHLVESIVMPALDFRGYHNFLPYPIRLMNNGYTVKLSLGSYKKEGFYFRPSISGAFLIGDYIFDSLHFHWGLDNSRGSEHVIENVRYPMEMHIVHINSNYSSWNEATKHKNGFVVLAFFFQVQAKDNRRYDPIIRNLKDITANGTSMYLDMTFPLVSILPRHKEFFYIYKGSLTTPPCSESVTWILFPDTILISFRQMQKFRNLELGENFRGLQPVGQRKIYFRSPKSVIEPRFPEYLKEEVSSKLFWLHT